ncbi:hypothetical protein D3C80_1410170 [compost metagenome]
MAVVGGDGGAQPARVDAAGLGQLFEAGAALEVAAAHMWPYRQWRGAGVAEVVAAQEAVVADQPRAGFLALRDRLEHGRHVVVVTVCLVDETVAIGQHTDDAGLAALDDVREVADTAVAVRHLGDRCPGHR